MTERERPKIARGAAYTGLADCYDILSYDCDYEEWSQYLVELLKSMNARSPGVDAGCGTGRLTLALKRAGYSVSGLDVSEYMLGLAAARAAEAGQRILFIRGGIESFKPPGKLGFVTAANDVFNYIEPKKLLPALRSVNRALKKGGVLLFDVSSEYKLRQVFAENVFYDDGEDVTLLWRNIQESERVRAALTIFSSEGELYSRADETHFLYVHTRSEIEAALTAAGFELVGCYAFPTLGAPVADSLRLQFAAVKP